MSMMSKIALLVLAAGVAALVMGGALEVKFRPDKLAQTPAAVKQYLADRGTLATLGTQATRLKRKAEGFLTNDPDQKFAVSVKYVQADAAKLVDQMESGSEPKKILTQADLLIDSVKDLSNQLASATEERAERLKNESTDAVSQAAYALGQLQELQAKYESYNEYLAQVSGELDTTISSIGQPAEGEKEVAGSKDENNSPEPAQESVPATQIPLKF